MGKFERLFRNKGQSWWEKLTHEDKLKWKKHYEKVCELTSKHKFPFPNMYDTTNIRVSKLSPKHISRIKDFVCYDTVNDKQVYN